MKDENLYQQEAYRGYTIGIYYDQYPTNPREGCDNLGTIYSNNRYYDFDKHDIDEILNEDGTYLSKEFLENHIWIDIRAYEHSGMTVSCSEEYPYNDPWDSSLFGIIAVSKEKAAKEFSEEICTEEVQKRALDILKAEVKDLDDYFKGNVFCYVVENEDGECVDSCSGYSGTEYIDEMIEECKGIVDYDIEKREKEHRVRLNTIIPNIEKLKGNTFIKLNLYRISVNNTIERAIPRSGRVREEYFMEINFDEVPESVLVDMADLIRTA